LVAPEYHATTVVTGVLWPDVRVAIFGWQRIKLNWHLTLVVKEILWVFRCLAGGRAVTSGPPFFGIGSVLDQGTARRFASCRQAGLHSDGENPRFAS